MKPAEVIDYWYSERVRAHWFSSTPELDAEILEKFEKTWEKAVEGELEGWRNTALGSLALILIFDQFPLNMFRGESTIIADPGFDFCQCGRLRQIKSRQQPVAIDRRLFLGPDRSSLGRSHPRGYKAFAGPLPTPFYQGV